MRVRGGSVDDTSAALGVVVLMLLPATPPNASSPGVGHSSHSVGGMVTSSVGRIGTPSQPSVVERW